MERAWSRPFLASLIVAAIMAIRSCDGFGMYGFNLHHRFSDPVKGILGFDDVPEKGSFEYYKVLAHGDRFFRGRHLASSGDKSPLAFDSGNETLQLGGHFGYLYYANISVGTPSASYLVALDTGSDLFWLPCDCQACVRGLKFRNGQTLEFNIYNTNTSSTGKKVACNSLLCDQRQRCLSENSDCPYQVAYLSNGTSSTGVLVEDVLHLTTDDSQTKDVDPRITFGCGRIQTGSFLRGAAPNGLLGLGIEDIAVPSILAKDGYILNSFSMCFGDEGEGRIKFGDNGTVDQAETPFNLRQSHPTYNISITQISVGGTPADLEFSAIFDSGTSFTYLNDPAYSLLTESFNLKTEEKRIQTDSSPFQYCYELSPNQTSFAYPIVNLTMKGGQDYPVKDPVVLASIEGGGAAFCLAVVKSEDINIIGQNFMTGNRVTFNRERLVLGWKPSNCDSEEETTTLPVKPSDSPSSSPVGTVDPEATAGPSNRTSIIPTVVPMGSHSTKLSAFTYVLLLLILFPLFALA